MFKIVLIRTLYIFKPFHLFKKMSITQTRLFLNYYLLLSTKILANLLGGLYSKQQFYLQVLSTIVG